MSRSGRPWPQSACLNGTALQPQEILGLGRAPVQPGKAEAGGGEEAHLAHRRDGRLVEERVRLDPVLQRVAGDQDAARAVDTEDRLGTPRGLEREQAAAAERHLAVDAQLLVGAQAVPDRHAGERPEGRAVAIDVEAIVAAVQVADPDHVDDRAQSVEGGEPGVIETDRVDDRQAVAARARSSCCG